MRKVLVVTIIMLSLGALLFAGCAAPTPTPAPAPAPAPSPAKTSAPAPAPPPAKAMVLKFTTHEPAPPPPPAEAVADPDTTRYWAAQVEEKTQGRIKIDVQWGGILGKPADFIKMVGKGGVADVGKMIGVYHTWETPIRCVSDLPFLTTGSTQAPAALDKLDAEYVPIQDELKKFNLKLLMNLQPHANWMCLNAKEAPKKLSDLAGMKIGPPGSSYAKVLQAFDITSVSVSAPETYEALQKGVIAGKVSALQNPKTFAHFEVTKYMVDLEFTGGQSVNWFSMNLDTWNKIPAADQKILMEVSAATYKRYTELLKTERQKLLDFYKSKGMTLVSFSPEEQAVVKEKASKPVWDAWVKEAESKSVPGAEVLKRYQDAVAAVAK